MAKFKIFEHRQTKILKEVQLDFSVWALCFPILWLLNCGLFAWFLGLFLLENLLLVMWWWSMEYAQDYGQYMMLFHLCVFEVGIRYYLSQFGYQLQGAYLLAHDFVEIGEM